MADAHAPPPPHTHPPTPTHAQAKKRIECEGVITKDEWYMGIAVLAGMRSKDPRTQVGCTVVNPDGIVVAQGYNGMPTNCSDDKLPWCKVAESELDTKFPYVVHAEANAILNSGDQDVAGCTLYTTLFPCNQCTKIILQARIKHIIFMSDKSRDKPSACASRRMLDQAGVTYAAFRPARSQICLTLEAPH